MIKSGKLMSANDILNGIIPYCVLNGKNNYTTNVNSLNFDNYYVMYLYIRNEYK